MSEPLKLGNKMRSIPLNESDRYTVRCRHGWGWEVRGPNGYQSTPISSALAAEAFCDVMNGQQPCYAAATAAMRAMGGYFQGER